MSVRFDDLPGVEVLQLPVGETRVKGLAPYRPRPGSKNHRLLTASHLAVERYRTQGRLPLGSREVGYVLTNEGFRKADIPEVEKVLVRARRASDPGQPWRPTPAGQIGWSDIADGRTSFDGPWQVAGAEEIVGSLLDSLETAQVDRQQGQPWRVEVWAEAAAWIVRLKRTCAAYGVSVYSGSGSVPVDAVRDAALRAIYAWVELGQQTAILQIGDLDLHGLRNIARPFEEDVCKFVEDYEFPGIVTVRRLMLTPDQVRQHVKESAWDRPTVKDRRAGWPWPFKVQAEALLPEVRDGIVTEALDSLLSDTKTREAAIATEVTVRAEARRLLREHLEDA